MNEFLNVYNHWELTCGDIAVDTFKEVYRRCPDSREVYYLTHPREVSLCEPKLQDIRMNIYKYSKLPYRRINIYSFTRNPLITQYLQSNQVLNTYIRTLSKQDNFDLEKIYQTLDAMNLSNITPVRLLYRDIFNYYLYKFCNDEIFALINSINEMPTLELLQESKEQNLQARNQQYYDMVNSDTTRKYFEGMKRRDAERRKGITVKENQ